MFIVGKVAVKAPLSDESSVHQGCVKLNTPTRDCIRLRRSLMAPFAIVLQISPIPRDIHGNVYLCAATSRVIAHR